MAALASADDPQAAGAAGTPDVAGSDASTEAATASRGRGKGTRSETTQEAPSEASPDPEPAPDPDAMVVALLLPPDETWCTADGTPYRASGGQPVYVRQRHVAELAARGATEPEPPTAPAPEPAAG